MHETDGTIKTAIKHKTVNSVSHRNYHYVIRNVCRASVFKFSLCHDGNTLFAISYVIVNKAFDNKTLQTMLFKQKDEI